jgi:hypothetical protein
MGKEKRELGFVSGLVIGIVPVLIAYILPKALERVPTREIRYSITGPTPCISYEAADNLSISVDGIPTTRLFSYRIVVWNSGNISLSNLPIRYSFSPKQEGFQIFKVIHQTTPVEEFGKVEPTESGNPNSKRFVYELLNPSEQDIVTIWTNQDAGFTLNTKSDGLRVVKEQEAKSTDVALK